MLLTTKGIVLHSLKYSETSIIVRIYTEARGLQSYLFKGIRNPKSKTKAGLFQPLTLLEVVSYIKEKTTLHTAKEVRLFQPYLSIPFDIRKSSVALFINELLYKSIREEEANQELFDYLWKTCLLLDSTENPLNCFPLVFTAELTCFLGIQPQPGYSEKKTVFNLRESQFQPVIPEKDAYILPEHGKLFNSLIITTIDRQSDLHFKSSVRRSLLDSLLLYYQIHIPGFKPMNSHHILHSVLS
ncbi:MAG: DNA repair protein RecO [Bacteroidetes bacterium]|nr:DNA repair protein RecO [Bacteroidota bacterium]